MLYQIFSLLLDVAVGLLSGACLLRLYMQSLRMAMSARSGNPLGRFVFALTDWIVLPLRRVLPSMGALDTASLVAAYALQLAEVGLLQLALSGLTAVVFAYVLLSWIPAQSPIGDVIERLAAPPLTPIRRILPLVGGFDLSPLALLVLLQIAGIVLRHIHASVLMAF